MKEPQKIKRNIQPLKVTRVDIPYEYVLSDVQDRNILELMCKGKENVFLETEEALYLLGSSSVFRFIKPEGLPLIIPAENLEISPDHVQAKIQLSKETLFAFAKRERVFLFETNSEFCIPGETFMFAKKERGKQ